MPRTVGDHHIRDQEVLRANHELAAYFKGERTEREAKAALKIIKAFIRDRQDTPVDKRRPLPGMKPLRVMKPKPRRGRAKKTETPEAPAAQTHERRNGES